MNWLDHYPAVRCRDCVHCPSKHGRRCELTRTVIKAINMPRRCTAYEAPEKPPTLAIQPRIRPDRFDRRPRHQIIRAEFGELWVGTEPAWSYAWNEQAETALLEDVRRWLRDRRETEFQRREIERRRRAITVVKGRADPKARQHNEVFNEAP